MQIKGRQDAVIDVDPIKVLKELRKCWVKKVTGNRDAFIDAHRIWVDNSPANGMIRPSTDAEHAYDLSFFRLICMLQSEGI